MNQRRKNQRMENDTERSFADSLIRPFFHSLILHS
jgi:hypothetical protein